MKTAAPSKTPLDKGNKHDAGTGLTFAQEPRSKVQVSMGEFMKSLDAFRAKYPQAALRKGEKGAAQQLTESRSAGY